MSKKRATGTREWAQKTVNCVIGCEHDCRYCYARYNLADRFGKIKREEWPKMRVREDEVRKSRPKYGGVVMFPSAHDITPKVSGPCMLVLEKLLDAGNTVLLVSKPHIEVITKMIERFSWATANLMFRFTIGSPRDDVLKFWEPGAPSFAERRDSLKAAHDAGFKTSISAEPLLDPDNVKELWDKLISFVNWEFWIGKLNKPQLRIDLDDPEVRDRLSPILDGQSDKRVMEIVKTFDKEPLIQWKDSYKEVIARCRK
jgi:DNA repair photolyase